MEKKIWMVTQAKGGAGKSVLTFLLAEKYRDAIVLDLDDATTTTMKQLEYRKPLKVSFLDATTKRIDRGAFNTFFTSIIDSKKDQFIADLGASVAEQLPKYFEMNGVENINEILTASNINLQVVCVVGGGNIFKSTMEYLAELMEATGGKLNITVAHNDFYPLADDQKATLQKFVTAQKLPLITFDLAKDKGESAMRTIENVLKDGKGVAGLDAFKALYFKKPIQDLSL